MNLFLIIYLFLVLEHNLVNDIDEEEEYKITYEQMSTWFSQGNNIVWNHLEHVSLGLFTLDNPIRCMFIEFMLNKWFDRIVLCSIIGNALCLAANNPLDSHGDSVSIHFFYFFCILLLLIIIILTIIIIILVLLLFRYCI